MIRVNLLPGGKKRPARGPKRTFSVPKLSGVAGDKWVLAAGAALTVAVLAIGYLFFSVGSREEDLAVAIEAAAQDSARYADLIEQAERLRARRDSIAQKVSIIQEIDGARYLWPHVLDEVARAIPDYTWLSGITQAAAMPGDLSFRITGRAGNNFALTRFMENLEASAFIRDVTLVTTERVVQNLGGQGRTRLVNNFVLDAKYEEPPPEILETVPLFQPVAQLRP